MIKHLIEVTASRCTQTSNRLDYITPKIVKRGRRPRIAGIVCLSACRGDGSTAADYESGGVPAAGAARGSCGAGAAADLEPASARGRRQQRCAGVAPDAATAMAGGPCQSTPWSCSVPTTRATRPTAPRLSSPSPTSGICEQLATQPLWLQRAVQIRIQFARLAARVLRRARALCWFRQSRMRRRWPAGGPGGCDGGAGEGVGLGLALLAVADAAAASPDSAGVCRADAAAATVP